jgi:hypothetical protein
VEAGIAGRRQAEAPGWRVEAAGRIGPVAKQRAGGGGEN